jgi:hypothetical protein
MMEANDRMVISMWPYDPKSDQQNHRMIDATGMIIKDKPPADLVEMTSLTHGSIRHHFRKALENDLFGT